MEKHNKCFFGLNINDLFSCCSCQKWESCPVLVMCDVRPPDVSFLDRNSVFHLWGTNTSAHVSVCFLVTHEFQAWLGLPAHWIDENVIYYAFQLNPISCLSLWLLNCHTHMAALTTLSKYKFTVHKTFTWWLFVCVQFSLSWQVIRVPSFWVPSFIYVFIFSPCVL